METGLRLLMRDGAVQVIFRPRLTAEQYAELALLVLKPVTKAELCEAVEEFAKQWGVQLKTCEDAI
jgi:hypothetical protein